MSKTQIFSLRTNHGSIFKLNKLQWNVDVEGTLRKGQLNVADTFCKNGQNHSQILLIKPVYNRQFILDTSI